MFLNINTGANERAEQYFEPKAPRITKEGKPHASDKSIDEQRATFLQDSALSAVTGRILVISLQIDDAPIIHLEGNEADIIDQFWSMIGHVDQFVTFDGTRFDWPYIIRRSWMLDIPVPILIDRPKKDSNFIDLLEVWRCGQHQEHISLTNLCKAMHVEAGLKITEPEISERFQWHYENNHPKALQYAGDEIIGTHSCFIKLLRRS